MSIRIDQIDRIGHDKKGDGVDRASLEYYARRIMPRVQEVILAVIGLGILILALNYMNLVTTDIAVLGVENFWKRVALVVLVIFFSSYIAITYGAYSDDDGPAKKTVRRIGGLFALFLLDLAQITFAASMFGVLYINDAAEVLAEPVCQQLHLASPCLALPIYGQTMIFAFGALWHVTVAVWYLVAEGLGDRNVRVHVGFGASYVILIQAHLHLGWFGGWWAIAAFAIVILWVYLTQARHWLRRDLTDADGTGQGSAQP